jgi:hypothetical protein
MLVYELVDPKDNLFALGLAISAELFARADEVIE